MILLKSKEEINGIKDCCKIVSEFLYKVKDILEPGVSTKEIEKLAWDVAKEYKARPAFYKYRGYPSACCVSINNEVVHGIPSDSRVLGEADIVSIDFGVEVDGLYGDGAWTYVVNGEVERRVAELLRTAHEALYVGIDVIKDGSRIGDISAAIQHFVEGRGFSLVEEYCGHGLGRNLHEDPPVPNKGKRGTGPKIIPGMVICIEPMVCLNSSDVLVKNDGWTVVTSDGGISAHFEHAVAIFEDGYDILTDDIGLF